MTSADFLKRLCEGYVRSYRTFGIRGSRDPREFNRVIDARAADVTHREVTFFSQLGEMLGFVARREVARKDRTRWDLSWVDIDSKKPFLCMESETFEKKADSTIGKLLRTRSSKVYLVGILGCLNESHFAQVKQTVSKRLKGRSLLLLAWVGSDMWHATKLKAIVACDGNVYTRQATAEPDSDNYWYARFDDDEWVDATGELLDRPLPPSLTRVAA